MRIILTIALLSISAMTMAACHHHNNGNGPPHCPPGHAKKGWC